MKFDLSNFEVFMQGPRPRAAKLHPDERRKRRLARFRTWYNANKDTFNAHRRAKQEAAKKCKTT